MGMFTWLTADTGKPATPASHAGTPLTVYLLSPEGKKYQEFCYEGYGSFGGMDAHELCARMNADHLGIKDWVESATHEELQIFGAFLETGDVYRDSSGQLWACFVPDFPCLKELGIRVAKGNYGQPIDEGLPSPNQLIDHGEWVEVPRSRLGFLKFPVKIVESPELSYGDVGASRLCSIDGIVYEDDPIEECEGL
jgi:hypothetical protein